MYWIEYQPLNPADTLKANMIQFDGLYKVKSWNVFPFPFPKGNGWFGVNSKEVFW